MPNTPAADHAGLSSPAEALARLGLSLPVAPKPVAAYVPLKQVGNLLYVSGQIPLRDGQSIAKGLVPGDVPLTLARECAVQCTLNALAAVKAHLESAAASQHGHAGHHGASAAIGGDTLRRIRQVVRVGCFVASGPGFTDHPQVANAASELLISLFGDAGKHARAAVGASSLPLGVPVEIEFVFEVH